MSSTVLIVGMNYSPEVAGVGRYTGEIAEYLASQGASVTVITTPAHYPGWRLLEPRNRFAYSTETLNGVRVIRCPLMLRSEMRGIWRLIAPLTFALAAAPVILFQMLRLRPQVALSIMPTLLTAPIFLLGAALTRSKTVLHVQDLEVDAAFAVGHLSDTAWLKSLALAFERRALTWFDQLITISDRMAAKLAEKGVRRGSILVIRNWVDLDAIKPLEAESPYRAELHLRSDDFAVLYSGNIGRKQGLDILLQAAELLAGERDIKIIVAGEGPAKADLVARYGLLPNVRFLPFQPMNRLSEFLGMADLHVLPQEPSVADMVLPSKLGGMLASGRPVLVVTEEETEMTTFLGTSVTTVPPADVRALASAIASASQQREPDPAQSVQRLSLAKRLCKSDGLDRFGRAIVGWADHVMSEPALNR